MSEYNLNRFIEAQEGSYATAISEIRQGKKRTHWMWYIFPQIRGLGSSSTSKYYAIKHREEAATYVQHPVLGARLKKICNALLSLDTSDPHTVFGSPDDVKLQSSMTLFSEVEGSNPVFKKVLEKFFGGNKDERTLGLIGKD